MESKSVYSTEKKKKLGEKKKNAIIKLGLFLNTSNYLLSITLRK